MFSQRMAKFQRLIVAANEQPTDWLIANVRNYRPYRDVTRLSLLACLRVIAARTDRSGLCYRAKMQATKQRIFTAQ